MLEYSRISLAELLGSGWRHNALAFIDYVSMLASRVWDGYRSGFVSVGCVLCSLVCVSFLDLRQCDSCVLSDLLV